MCEEDTELLERVKWALETKRQKLMFGLDPLSAALARERRLFAVLLDCEEYLTKLKPQKLKDDDIEGYSIEDMHDPRAIAECQKQIDNEVK